MDKTETLSKHIAALVKLRENINSALREPFNVELNEDLKNLGTYMHHDARSVSTEFVRRKRGDDPLLPSNFEKALRHARIIGFGAFSEYISDAVLIPLESKISSLKKEMMDNVFENLTNT